jgi:ADP-ribosylglycohydrolase
MLGAITGDVVGSVYEWANIKHKNFEPLFGPRAFFTDDTVLTVALMDAIDRGVDYGKTMHWYYTQHPNAGYGHRFHHWCKYESDLSYNSWGNGSAMRTSAVGYAYDTIERVLEKAEYFASFTHDHPEGIKGAQATCACIFMARNGATKEAIRTYVTNQFGYDLNRTIDDIRPDYTFNESCQGTVPEAIVAFLDSTDFEDAIRCAISLGGDSDTLTCITGGIAEAYYGDIPTEIAIHAMQRLTPQMRDVVVKFYDKYRPSETIRQAHKMADKLVIAREVKRDDKFHEKQRICWTMALRESADSDTSKDLEDKGWSEDYDVKSPDTAMQKFKKLFDL